MYMCIVEFDSRTPEEWLKLGQENGIQKPIPGKSLLAGNMCYLNILYI